MKKVNIEVKVPIRSLRMPLSVGKYYNVEMSPSDIFKCICGRALVDEVLSNGTTLRLDLKNYNKDNDVPVQVKVPEENKEPAKPVVPEVKEEPKVEVDVEKDATSEVVEEPVVETVSETVEPAAEPVKEDIDSEPVVEEEAEEAATVEESKIELSDEVKIAEESVVEKPKAQTTHRPKKKH